jgi:hypothetical protein
VSFKFLLLGLAFFLLGGNSQQSIFIQRLPVEVSDGVEIDGFHPIRIAAYARDPSAVARAIHNPHQIGASGDHLLIDIDSDPLWDDAPLERHREPSFVIDFEEPAVLALRQSMTAAPGAALTVDGLVTFAGQAIPNKIGTRGFDVASRAAERQEGDCTEHAVLLTALARAAGFPARVVVGVALVRQGNSIAAFGHAWSEIFNAGKWRRADATGIGEHLQVRYLRAGSLDDEGPGFALDLMRLLQIERIAIVGNLPRKADGASSLAE